MPMYEKKVKITGSAKSKPAAKKPTMPTKPSANMTKMNKSAATGKPKLGGAGNPNYVKDMVKKGKSKPKPGMMK
jgi:hypothetical protein